MSRRCHFSRKVFQGYDNHMVIRRDAGSAVLALTLVQVWHRSMFSWLPGPQVPCAISVLCSALIGLVRNISYFILLLSPCKQKGQLPFPLTSWRGLLWNQVWPLHCVVQPLGTSSVISPVNNRNSKTETWETKRPCVLPCMCKGTWDSDTWGMDQIYSQAGLHSKFQVSLL